MSLVTTPKAGMPIAGNLPASSEMLRWMWDIDRRVGGVMGSSSDDLTLAQFEDAGIEETKAALFGLADAANQMPLPMQPAEAVDLVPVLLEEINALRRRVEALEQGATA